MDYRDSTDEAAYRAALRSWLTANIPEGWESVSDGLGSRSGAARGSIPVMTQS
jgi:hypothetical protein